MSKVLVRVTERKDSNVSFESMDGKFKETMPEETFNDYFIFTKVANVYEMLDNPEIDEAVELMNRHMKWLTPHLWNILSLQNKASKGETLSVTEYATFGAIVADYCRTFDESQADFILAVDSARRFLEGDK